jgi:hypothetical protein
VRRAPALALALAAVSAGVRAHPMPNSTLVVQMGPGDVELVASIPISELKAATDEAPASEAGGYVVRHAAVIGADGRGWVPLVREVAPGDLDGYAIMSVRLGFSPPADGASQAAGLKYDAVTHRIASHFVLVFRRTGDGLVPLGRLQSPTTELKLP